MNIAFDIDQTLLVTPRGSDRPVPNYALIGVLRWFRANHHFIYAWSGGGVGYTESTLYRLGLERYVTAIPKTAEAAREFNIELAFDDQPIALGTARTVLVSEALWLDF